MEGWASMVAELADFIKLTGKETVIPEGANQFLFLAAPVAGIVAAVVTGAILISGSFLPVKVGFNNNHLSIDDSIHLNSYCGRFFW